MKYILGSNDEYATAAQQERNVARKIRLPMVYYEDRSDTCIPSSPKPSANLQCTISPTKIVHLKALGFQFKTKMTTGLLSTNPSSLAINGPTVISSSRWTLIALNDRPRKIDLRKKYVT